MSNTYLPSSTLRSPAAAIAERGIFKPGKRKDWTTDREVPYSVLIEREKAERRESVQQMRSQHERSRVKRLGVFAKTTPEGLKIVGFGATVQTEEEVKQLAIANGRQFYKIDDGSEVNV
jgi:hypothetical protein